MADNTLAERLVARCLGDGEFRLASRYWDGALRLAMGDDVLRFTLSGGVIASSAAVTEDASGFIGLRGPRGVWDKVLAPIPQPGFTDVLHAAGAGLVVEGQSETIWQYYPAVRRFIDLLRKEVEGDAAL